MFDLLGAKIMQVERSAKQKPLFCFSIPETQPIFVTGNENDYLSDTQKT